MSLIKELKKEFQPGLLLPGLTAGFIAAIVSISIMISLAALIWSGPLHPFLGNGIGFLLFGAFVIGVIVAVTSSLPGVVAIPQDTPAAILALVAAGIAAAMKAAQPQALYVTVVAATMVTSLLMAACFLLLGSFKASGFVRYIPYPVVGGFLAGTGFLLAKGAFGVMVDLPADACRSPPVIDCRQAHRMAARCGLCRDPAAVAAPLRSLPDHARRADRRNHPLLHLSLCRAHLHCRRIPARLASGFLSRQWPLSAIGARQPRHRLIGLPSSDKPTRSPPSWS